MLRWLTGLLLVSLLVAGAAFWFAGRGRPPVITIERPERVVGQTGTLDVVVEAPGGRFTSLTVALEQDGRTIPLFSLEGDVQSTADGLQKGAEGTAITQTGPDTVRVSRPLGKQSVPELQQGAARIAVAASQTLLPEPAHLVEHGCEGLSRSDSTRRALRSYRRITT